MDIANKVEYAKKQIDSIATHDDANDNEVREALGSLVDYCEAKWTEAAARRAQAE